MQNVIEMLKLRKNYYKSGILFFREQMTQYLPKEKRWQAHKNDLKDAEKNIKEIEMAIEILEKHE